MIPDNPSRKRPRLSDPVRYNARNAIERTAGRLKDWRRVHTRYNKPAANLASTVAPAAILHGWC